MKRNRQDLAESLARRLNSYALAAGAGSLGLLAINQPAQAKIIYTPTDIKLSNGLGLDLNNDQKNDFAFVTARATTGTIVDIVPNSSKNLIWGRLPFRYGDASALRTGFTVRASKKFAATHTFMCYTAKSSGQWLSAQKRYLGLKFQINGQTHYGWARLSFNGCRGTLTGYAYETIPNKPIIAGKTRGLDVITIQPASLGHLARGASAIPAWRMKPTVATTH